MERFVGKVAVVTGASSGIGASLCRELVKLGLIVAGLARRVDRLQSLSDELNDSTKYRGKFYPVKCDVTKEEEIHTSIKWVCDNVGPISIHVNNAAVLECTLLSDITGEMITKSYDTNVKAVLLFSKEVVKNMIDHSMEGHIININSIAGQMVINIEPNLYILYSSTKHALRVISEGLRLEMKSKKANIKVTNISPGYTMTEMTGGLEIPPEFQTVALQAEDIANACISALNTPPHVLISELTVMPLHQNV